MHLPGTHRLLLGRGRVLRGMDQFDELPVDRGAVQMEVHRIISLAPQPLAKIVDRRTRAGPRQFECAFHRADLSRHGSGVGPNRAAREKFFVLGAIASISDL